MRHVVIGTAGHIDHGKSTLVHALTGTDPDRLQEEKARGITIDLGFAHTVEDDVVLSFVDVPGHERFVRNMLAGVGGVDLAMLHVAADESVMPQTREHFDICRLLRVPAGLVVITKSDLVDPDTLDVVRLEVRDLLAGSFLENAPVVAVSARTGAGLPALRQVLTRLAAAAPLRRPEGPPRLPIDRVFTMRGFGTVVTGTLVSGRLDAEQELMLLPSARPVKVRGLQVHGRPFAEAFAGQRVAVNLSGVEVGDVSRGETLTVPGAVTVTRRLDVVLELLPGARAIRHGARVRFHQGTRELQARVALPGEAIAEGRHGSARLHLESAAALVRGDRFILRSASPPLTIGGGTILDPQPPRRGVRTATAAERFARLSGVPIDAVIVMVEEAGLKGLAVTTLRSRVGVAGGELSPMLAMLAERGVSRVGDLLVSDARLAAVRDQVKEAIRQHHARHPLEEGLPREELRERLFGAASPAVFEHVLAILAAAGEILGRDRMALRGHTLAMSDDEAKARDIVLRELEQGGLGPPDVTELAARTGTAKAVMDRVIAVLLRQKRLVRIGDLLFHPVALQLLKDDVRTMKEDGTERLDVGTFKDRYRVTRKYAIPLLEYLDRERVTRRVGDVRVIL